MNDKEFFDEVGNIHNSYRLAYNVMELFIETLTGTCFELRVSPYETVISVKAKIQRLEGIPVSQQYLIWKNIELDDECCLRDYNITDGCTLKLVLAMRGGPINTRRVISMEESGADLPDHIENPEDLFEKPNTPHSGGNGTKQVTLLVYRDGDQLNFFRVVDRGDGTLTPFSESLSGSQCNLREEEEDEIPLPTSKPPLLSVAQMVENNITASKMKQLRTNIENLNVNTSTKNTPSMQPKPPSHPRVADGVQLKRHTRKSVKIKSPTMLHSKNDVTEVEKPIIKKLSTDIRRSLSNEATTFPEATNEACHSRLRCFRNVTSKSKNSNEATEVSYSRKERKERDSPKTIQGETEGSGRFSPRTRRLLNALESETYQRKSYVFPRARQMSGMTFNRHDMYLRSYGLLPTPDQAPTIPDSPSPRTSDELDSKVYETNQGVQYSSIDGYPVPPYWYAGRGFLKSPKWNQGDPVGEFSKIRKNQPVRGASPLGRKSPILSTLAMNPIKQSDSSHEERSQVVKSALRNRRFTPEPPKELKPRRHNKLVRTPNIDLGMHPPEGTSTPFRQAYTKTSIKKHDSQAKVESMSKQEAREVVDFINKAVDSNVLRNLVRSPTKDTQRGSSGQSGHHMPSSSIRYSDKSQPLKSPRGTMRPPPLLPPVKPPSKKKRCALCGKRTGLATSYICRCGNNFCAIHRYAETHDCTYDYKTAGRKILKEANPLVNAPKLPKI